tara:strand:+ start:220 stop:570 length:351 start_codon:yes stop_codon:yes gene_type:complete
LIFDVQFFPKVFYLRLYNKWKHISENTAISKAEKEIWLVFDVPPENSETGRHYIISDPVAKYLEGMRKVSNNKKPYDFLFCNQQITQNFSENLKRSHILVIVSLAFNMRKKMIPPG